MSMTFGAWLIKHKNRNSPLGDLARDYIADGSIEDFTYEYFLTKHPCDEAIEAYHRAIKSWGRWLHRLLRPY